MAIRGHWFLLRYYHRWLQPQFILSGPIIPSTLRRGSPPHGRTKDDFHTCFNSYDLLTTGYFLCIIVDIGIFAEGKVFYSVYVISPILGIMVTSNSSVVSGPKANLLLPLVLVHQWKREVVSPLKIGKWWVEVIHHIFGIPYIRQVLVISFDQKAVAYRIHNLHT